MALFGRRKTTEPDVVEQVEPRRLPAPPPNNPEGNRAMLDHRDYVVGLVEPLPPFGMQLLDAWDLALCEDIHAHTALPRFDRAGLDGYAVRAEDVAGASPDSPRTLKVTGALAIGQTPVAEVTAGQTIRVAAGAAIPRGADAVLPIEFTHSGESDLRVHEPVAEGEYIRRAGSDLTEGQLIASSGERLDARRIGLLAAAGMDKVLVRPRPRIVIMSIGSELIEAGREANVPGPVHDANSWMIAAAAKAEGAQVWRISGIPDDPAEIRDAIADQLIRADLVITIGGIGEGEADILPGVIAELGMLDLASVAMHPGRRNGFALVGEDDVPLLMLPGNPVSAYVAFQAFGRPVIRKLMGASPLTPSAIRCIAASTIRGTLGRLEFVRGVVRDSAGRRMVETAPGHGSHRISQLSDANALILLGEDTFLVNAGEAVMVWLLDQD
ncbi:MAG TPA: gephyrin-like molybdotransferase Glp [Propionibacteriaceae bacterium]|nr:gephyrin-like molybdotransferase Glp [Propionibacteriaceae bacterium]